MKKTILSLFLTLCIAVGVTSVYVVPAFAAIGNKLVDNRGDYSFQYIILSKGETNTVLLETVYGNCPDDLEIPSSVTDPDDGKVYSVTEISAVPFPSNITSVTIPNSVTSIREGTFSNCINLTSVTIPNSVISIGYRAFYNAYYSSSLSSVTFEENSRLSSIGEEAFYCCRSLTSITIPKSVTSIGDKAFSDSAISVLSSVAFEEGSQLSSIGEQAFARAIITSITIPKSVTSIGKGAFNACDSLQTVNFEEGSQLSSIGERAFSSKSLTSITIPKSVTSIGNNVFYRCANLQTVNFEKGSQLSSIGSNAFLLCKNLTSIAFGCTFDMDLLKNGTALYFNPDDDTKFGLSTDNTTTGTITVVHGSYADSHDTTCSEPGCKVTREPTHAYGSGWSSDDLYHYHACTCGDKADLEQHSPKTVNAKEATAAEKGYTGDVVCQICSYTLSKGQVIPAEAVPAGFEDSKPASAKTADYSNISLWITLLLVSSLALAGTIMIAKKKACR